MTAENASDGGEIFFTKGAAPATGRHDLPDGGTSILDVAPSSDTEPSAFNTDEIILHPTLI
jgi:hypothetical protein